MTKIKIKGEKELVRALKRMTDSVRADALERIAHDAMIPLERDYRSRAHPTVQPGVHTRTIEAGRGRFKAEVATGSRHPLAHIFEFGTKLRTRLSGAITGRIRPLPFARPAFDRNAAKVIRGVGKSLWRVVSRAGH